MNTKSKQPNPLLEHIAANCACFQVRRASRLISQHYDQAFAALGLRGTQFTLLVAISLHGPVTVKQLADGIGIDRTTLTRNLKRLAGAGLIAMVPGQDRRERLAELTSAGHTCLEKALPLWQQAQEEVLSQFPSAGETDSGHVSEWHAVRAGLAKLGNLGVEVES